MRLFSLYLRTRLAGWALAVLLASGAVDWLWLFKFPPQGALLTVSLVALPLLPAVVIGAGVHSPFGDIERTASRDVGMLRLGHLVALLLIAAFVLFLGSSQATTGIERELIRNLAGYLGLTLLTAWLIGTGLSWVAPLGYAVVTLLLLPSNLIAWTARFPLDRWSLTVAAVLLVLGLLAVTPHGARDQPE